MRKYGQIVFPAAVRQKCLHRQKCCEQQHFMAQTDILLLCAPKRALFTLGYNLSSKGAQIARYPLPRWGTVTRA